MLGNPQAQGFTERAQNCLASIRRLGFFKTSPKSCRANQINLGVQGIGYSLIVTAFQPPSFTASFSFASVKLTQFLTSFVTLCCKDITWVDLFLHLSIAGLSGAEFGMVLSLLANADQCSGYGGTSSYCFNIIACEVCCSVLLGLGSGTSEYAKVPDWVSQHPSELIYRMQNYIEHMHGQNDTPTKERFMRELGEVSDRIENIQQQYQAQRSQVISI